MSISKKLLPHDITYNKFKGSDGDEITYEAAIIISNVRYEDKQKKVMSNGEVVLVSTGLIMIDAVNSTIAGGGPLPEFTNDSLIKFNGNDYSIVEVNTIYTTKPTPHHFELRLI